MKPRNDVSGQKFGRLTAVEWISGPERGKGRFGGGWLCRCDCGETQFVLRSNLLSGASKSCGCLARELLAARSGTHRMTGSREYRIWANMLTRCGNPNTSFWHRYGGRGIAVCARWTKFDNFFADMGACPSQTHSIDRIDNDGDYEPGNCRWATEKEQQSNRRTNKTLTVNGTTLTQTEWARRSGIPLTTICSRLRDGWSVEDAVSRPSRPIRARSA